VNPKTADHQFSSFLP